MLGRGWAARAPRLALSLWLALAMSWVAAAALAVLSVTAPVLLSWLAGGGQRATAFALDIPAGTATALARMLVAAVIVGWPAGWMTAEFTRCRADTRAHSAFLAVAGCPDPDLGVIVLADDEPAAWCLAGRNSRRNHPALTNGGILAAASAR